MSADVHMPSASELADRLRDASKLTAAKRRTAELKIHQEILSRADDEIADALRKAAGWCEVRATAQRRISEASSRQRHGKK